MKLAPHTFTFCDAFALQQNDSFPDFLCELCVLCG